MNTVKKLTKPEITERHYHRIGFTDNGMGTPSSKETEHAGYIRNFEFLKSISRLTKTDFRKKLADSLSNIRDVDTFVALEPAYSKEREIGRRKIVRKCQEIIVYLLPRASQIAPTYFVQLVSEIESLIQEYGLTEVSL